MGKALFAFLALYLTASFSWALPAIRQLNCELKTLKKVDVFLDQELNLARKPVLKFVDNSSQWSLQIGDAMMETRKSDGYKLKKRSTKLHGQVREYSFWVNDILRYQFEVDLTRKTLILYWWGTGRRTYLADFNCDIRN